MEMIDELCYKIYSNPKFQSEYKELIQFGISAQWTHKHEIFDSLKLKRLIESATHFSISNQLLYRKIAYEIGLYALKASNNNPAINEIVSLIFTRLGNFPAEKYLSYKKDLDRNKLPIILWYEEEFHRLQNTAAINSEKRVILTDFQKKLWDSMEKYKYVIVVAPTSSGKSFVLQNYIVNQFSQRKNINAVYIVPTRALISQTIKEIVSEIKKNGRIDLQITEVPFYSEEFNIPTLYILTPERLQTLLDSPIKIDYLVVDEAQNIAAGSRGVILNTVVEKIKKRNSELKILFGSPFTKNPKVFIKVFNLNEKDVKIVETEESPVLQNLLHVQTDLYRANVLSISKIGENNTKEYKIDDLNTNMEFVLSANLLPQIAYYFGKKNINIIFGSEPSQCEKIAKKISDLVSLDESVNDPELNEFSDFIKEHVHKNYLLAEVIKNRVAYHYGNLPSFIRNGIEELCNDGKISYIVCTTTLLQGVNLPAQNIFIMQPTKGRSNGLNIPLSSTEFWNLAGRAGRLTKDFEGNVFLINMNNWLNNPLIQEKKQSITPSFKYYLCDCKLKLVEFMKDKQHPSGKKETQGLENSFMKLINDYNMGDLENTLNIYSEDISNTEKDVIIRTINDVVESCTIPKDILEKNPNVSIYRQQEMLDYLLKAIKLYGPEYVIPPHPLHQWAEIDSPYTRFIESIHIHFEKINPTNRSYIYYKNLCLLWMRGESYADLLQSSIDYNQKHRKKGITNVNTQARKLFHEIEFDLRFRYVKFSKCYIDLLKYALQFTHSRSYSIPAIDLFLELGASSQTMISLISMGISRTGASILAKEAPKTDMNILEAKAWLSNSGIETLNIPTPVKIEIGKIFY